MYHSLSWENFIANCLACTSTEDLNKFFQLTLTPAEREKIAARYMILSELINGSKTHREIAANLKVSIFNVTRGANQLKVTEESARKLIK